MADTPILKQYARFCQRLKLARLEMSIKQQQVASYLQIPISAVSAFETGKRNVGAWELYQLSKLYCKPIQWFFDLKPAEPPHTLQGLSRVHSEILPQRESLMFEEPELLECFMLLKQASKSQRRKIVAHINRLLQSSLDDTP